MARRSAGRHGFNNERTIMSDFNDAKPGTDSGPVDLRGAVSALMAAGLPRTEIAREAGVNASTLSLWHTGKYTGDNAKIDDQIGQYLEARAARQKAGATLPRAPSFIATPTAEAFVAALEYAQFATDVSVITGGAGVGKTTASTRYAATHPNVWLMTAEPTMASANYAMDELGEVVGITERAAAKRSRAIISRISGTGGLIIVDEAQHLSSPAIDQLRSIHDKAQVGLALVGNHTVSERLGGIGRQLAQLHSRVGMRILRNGPLVADIDALIEAWKVEGKPERQLLRAIAKKPGALRSLTKVLRVAHMLAGGEAVQARHITTAWARVSEQTLEAEAA